MKAASTTLTLERKASLQSAAFDLGGAPALVFNDRGEFLTANRAAEDLLGRSLGLLGRRILGDLTPTSVLPGLVERVGRDGVVLKERGVEFALADGPVIEADVTASPLPDACVLLTVQPRSPRTGLERQADTLRSVAGMGRTLAHEVKNPLAGIRGAAQLLKSNASPDDAALAQIIVDETDRIRRLIDRVEAFSDQRPPERQRVNIHRTLNRVRALVSVGAGEGIVFKDHFDPSLPHAWGDEDQLVQIFLNLMKNAAEAAHTRGDRRGEVMVSTAYRHSERASPLEVQVQDNGPGVAADLRERLFDPFITTKPQGEGLGLTLVAKLVADHGGLITFDSEPGRTVFRVLLPVRAPLTSQERP